nr:MAG TPA: hypothetical protein [Caudoviricetes sp.]
MASRRVWLVLNVMIFSAFFARYLRGGKNPNDCRGVGKAYT